MNEINLLIAFGAGFASFISPCCLPLYPSYLSYITGITVAELKNDQMDKKKSFLLLSHTLFFMLGFSIVYYTLSYGVNAFSDFFFEYDQLIRQLSALLIVIMGLFLLGVLQPKLLLKDTRINLIPKKVSYISSFIFGIGFSAGWTPCVGPALTMIVAMAATEPGTWFQLTTAYAIGFALPFFILAFFIGKTSWLMKYSSKIMKIGGVIMILMGILLFTNKMTNIVVWLNGLTPEWLKF